MGAEEVKVRLKKVLKSTLKHLIIILLPVIMIVVILTGALYYLTISDGTWENTRYAASAYTSSVSVNSNGTLSTDISSEELWDTMLNNGSNVTSYLDSAEELEKLMKAEIVTQYPDTRSNPDEDIDWQSMIGSDTMQGIIKFKRADSNNQASTMTYVDANTFNSYIEEYNRTGSDTAKQNALTHFTLKKSISLEQEDNTTTNGRRRQVTSSLESSSYTAVVATWKQVETTITSDDENVNKFFEFIGETQTTSETQYIMTTTNINYEEMVEPYTMPFEFLWALLVIGEDKDFVFELADLVYGSDIAITIYDNLTVNTDVDEWNYTKKTKAVVNATITETFNGVSETGTITNDEHDPDLDTPPTSYTTTKKVVTKTNTVNAILTRANVWIVDYSNNFNYVEPTETTSSNTITKDDQEEYSDSPDSTGESYKCEHIDAKEQELKDIVTQIARENDLEAISEGINVEITQASEEIIRVDYYNKYVDISDNITNTINTQRYTQGTPSVMEKTDRDSQDPNFVTIFNKIEYKNNKNNILDVDSWLFEILETNPETTDMVDLMKYLLYKATDSVYDGVDTYDFCEYNATLFNSISGIYGGTIQEKVWFALKNLNYSDVAIAGAMGNIAYESGGFNPNAVESGGSGIGLIQWSGGRAESLQAYANNKGVDWTDEDTQIEFLIGELSGQGAAVALNYAQPRTSGSVKEGDEIYTSTSTDWAEAETVDEATRHFMIFFESPASMNSYDERLSRANGYYDEFQGKEASSSNLIGEISLSSGNKTKMTAMLTKAIAIANDDSYTYVYGAAHDGTASWAQAEPKQFDCSSFIGYLYYKYFGVYIGGNTTQIKENNNNIVSLTNLQPGDILWRSGHVDMYLGNGLRVGAHSASTGIYWDEYNPNYTCAIRIISE